MERLAQIRQSSKISRVHTKIEPTIQPVTNYMDTIIQGWFYDDETYEIAMVKIKYDSDISTLMPFKADHHY